VKSAFHHSLYVMRYDRCPKASATLPVAEVCSAVAKGEKIGNLHDQALLPFPPCPCIIPWIPSLPDSLPTLGNKSRGPLGFEYLNP
jgi:hypothetical protein